MISAREVSSSTVLARPRASPAARRYGTPGACSHSLSRLFSTSLRRPFNIHH